MLEGDINESLSSLQCLDTINARSAWNLNLASSVSVEGAMNLQRHNHQCNYALSTLTSTSWDILSAAMSLQRMTSSSLSLVEHLHEQVCLSRAQTKQMSSTSISLNTVSMTMLLQGMASSSVTRRAPPSMGSLEQSLDNARDLYKRTEATGSARIFLQRMAASSSSLAEHPPAVAARKS
jgi:hypothetical protein